MSPGYLHRAQHRSLLFASCRRPHGSARRARGHHLTGVVATLVLALALTGCTAGGERQEVIVTGSTTLLPITEVSGEMYTESHDGIAILVSGMGSSAGIESV